MPISVYLAVKPEEIVNYPQNLLLQIGFGFHPDGSVRLPQQVKKCPALIDDLHLPNFSSSALQVLKSKLSHGCILDFERTPTPIHKKLIQGLRDKRILALPTQYHQYASGSLPIVSCAEPCNSWLQFVTNTQKLYPNGWMLEITPWSHQKISTTNKNEGFLANALCNFQRKKDKVLYYDTKETINEKLKIAQEYSCKGAIALYSEVKSLK